MTMRFPRQETLYLTTADVIAIHEEIVARTGAVSAPLRDEGLLESALTRPKMAAHYEGADLVRQATLLAIGISQAQSFVDGNKRTGYAVAEVFLDINGLEMTCDPLDLARHLEEVASRNDSLDAATDRFDSWLRGFITSRSD